MKVARVIGNIWATRKEQKLSGFTLLILQRINITTGEDDGAPEDLLCPISLELSARPPDRLPAPRRE